MAPSERFHDPQWPTWKCSACGTAFVWPLPDATTLARFYRWEDYGARVYNLPDWLVEGRRRLVGDLLDIVQGRLGRAGSLLDVGCSVGLLLDVAQRAGWRVEGIELDPETASRTRKALGVTVHAGLALSVLPTLGSYDLIVMSHWLEHCTNPGRALQVAAEHLRPGGGLFLRVPNADSLLARFTGASWSWFSPPNHLFYFDEASLRTLSAARGLTEDWSMALRGDALLLPIELGIAFYRRVTGKAVSEIRGARAAMAPTFLSRALERAFPATRPWLRRNDTELAILLRRPGTLGPGGTTGDGSPTR